MNEHSRTVIDKLRLLKPAFVDMRIIRLRVFGSVARGEAKPDSDVDILVDFMDSLTLFDVMDVREKMERELNVPVDLVTPGALHPALKDRILREARDV